MNDKLTTKTTTPVTKTTPETTTATTKEKGKVLGSMQVGVDTSGIKFKSLAEMRREFGDNWM